MAAVDCLELVDLVDLGAHRDVGDALEHALDDHRHAVRRGHGLREAQRGFDMDYHVQLSFENINAPEIGVYGVDHVAVAEGLGCKAIRVTDPHQAQAAFATARQWMKEYQVPVVVEFILERVTNIAMGTEIDNIVEFEEILDLPLDDAPARSSEALQPA